MARPVPVLPEVGSMIVPPALSFPSRSAASIRRSATRSLIDPPGIEQLDLGDELRGEAGADAAEAHERRLADRVQDRVPDVGLEIGGGHGWESRVGAMERIQALLEERELDALLITDLVNVRWLTGFPSSNALVVVTADRLVLITDFRYVAGARRSVTRAEVVEGQRDLVDDAVALLPAGRIGFEDAGDDGRVACAAGWTPRVRTARSWGWARRSRGCGRSRRRPSSRRSPRAVALGDDALSAVLERGLVGKRESEVAALLEYELRARGAQQHSFPPIVASGTAPTRRTRRRRTRRSSATRSC